MAAPETLDFHELVLEVELDPTGASGVYTKLCGFSAFNVNRALSTQEITLLDCDDYSLPLRRKVSGDVYSMDISGNGVMAKQNKDILINWISKAEEKNVRITHVGAATGEIEHEAGVGLLTQFDNAMDKSSSAAVTADMAISVSGEITIDLAP